MSRTRINLLVSEPRKELRDVWPRISKGLPVQTADGDIRQLLSAEVDAVIMPGWAAHERLGGTPVPGQSSVISNERGLIGKPRWVITTPPFASLAEDARRLGIPQWPDDPKRRGFETFSRVFAAVEAHNEHSRAKISTVAFEPEFLNFSNAYTQEAEGVIEALRDLDRSGPRDAASTRD